MSWLRTDVRPEIRRAVFYIPARDFRLDELLQPNRDQPFVLEALLRKEFERVRPELCGAVVYFMDFDVMRNAWVIGVCHDSLAPVPDGAESPYVPLTPAPSDSSS